MIHRMTRRAVTRLLLPLALGCGAFATPAQAQSDNSSITWVVPYAPGAGSDTIARYLAEQMSSDLKQTIVVENVAGAGTAIAAARVARKPADGTQVMTADITTLAINPAINEKLNYDPKAFTHIGMFANLPFVLVGNVNTAPKTFAEVLTVAKSQPDALNYGSAGLGSPHHLAMELLLDQAGGKMTHVPFKGIGPAINELLAGRVQVMFSTLGAIESHLKAGTLRAYGVSSPKRLEQLPDVPTIAEQGSKGYEAAAWQGLVAPAGVPAATVERLNASLRRVLATDATKKKMFTMGIEPVSGTPKDFVDYAGSQAKLWSNLVKTKGLKVE